MSVFLASKSQLGVHDVGSAFLSDCIYTLNALFPAKANSISSAVKKSTENAHVCSSAFYLFYLLGMNSKNFTCLLFCLQLLGTAYINRADAPLFPFPLSVTTSTTLSKLSMPQNMSFLSFFKSLSDRAMVPVSFGQSDRKTSNSCTAGSCWVCFAFSDQNQKSSLIRLMEMAVSTKIDYISPSTFKN
jgi:hypothetical protein